MDSSSEYDENIDIEELLRQIQVQESLNKNLKEDLGQLTGDCDVLEGYRNEIKDSLLGLREEEISIANTLSSFTSIQDQSNYSLPTQEKIQFSLNETEFKDVYIPTTRYAKIFSSLKPCRGCGREFGKYKNTFEDEYYIHCIKKCPRYRAFGWIKKCNNCEKLFANGKSLRLHACDQDKPMYQGKEIALTRYVNVKIKNFKFVPCKGCGKKFKKNRNYRHFENDYYVHCIKDCKEYQNLGLAKVCLGCDKWFLNQNSISKHPCSVPIVERTTFIGKEERVFRGTIVRRPKWMPRKRFEQCAPLSINPMKPKRCPGCKIWIEDAIIRNGKHSFNYFVHCIEECDAYKKLNLIRDCSVCDFKFMNNRCYKLHMVMHKE